MSGLPELGGKEYDLGTSGQVAELPRASSLHLFWKDKNKMTSARSKCSASPQPLPSLPQGSFCVLSPPTEPNQSFKETLAFQRAIWKGRGNEESISTP